MTADMDLVRELEAATQMENVPKLRQSMARFWKQHSGNQVAVTSAAIALWQASPGDQGEMARMAVAILLGPAAVETPDAMAFMLSDCADDPSWRVQEALAKGLDWQCDTRGWEASVPAMEGWLTHPKANVRRAAAEGPRVWTQRAYFADAPTEALRLLGMLRNDASEYVLKSVGNAISDMSKAEPELVLKTLERWVADHDAARTMVRRACRKLRDTHPERTEVILAKL